MNEAPPPELVIFDCDGVLVDSEVLVLRIEQDLLAERGVRLEVDQIAERYVGLSDPEMARRVADEFGVELDAAFDERKAVLLVEAFDAALAPVAGIVEVLGALTLPRCVASSSSPDRIARSLRVTGLDDLVGPHRFSASQVRHGKPAPDLFELAARAMGVIPDRCVVVEDSVPGIVAARAAGMAVVAFGAGGHCGPDHEARCRAAGAHDWVSDATGLIDRLGAPGGRDQRDGRRGVR